MIDRAQHPDVPEPTVASDTSIDNAARSIIEQVSTRRATWQPHHVWAEARRVARARHVPVDQIDDVCRQLTDAALSSPLSVARGIVDTIPGEPELFHKHTCESVYVDANTRQYTSWSVLDAEQRLVANAALSGGRQALQASVEIAILEHAANNPGRELNTGQMMLVREFALSGKRMQLALAPAGTGKTTAMAVLARAWEADDGHVLGLAPQGSAAGVLQADLGTDTATIDKLVHVLDSDPESTSVPDWFRRIGPDSLVVIDEAGLAGTEILDRAVQFVLDRGGVVRLLGDDRQQGAVAAGGVIRDIAETSGAISLTEVMRFHDPAEGAATLALRDGDPAAIGFYLDNGRIHEGEFAALTDELYSDWATDITAGRDGIMLAGTREVVADLNARARADRLARLDRDTDAGPETRLSDGNHASIGDVVITRRNDARYRISHTDHVRNGYRWTVSGVTDDGGMWVTHLRSGRRTYLPPGYVHGHVELGYASTIRSSQGLTADTARTLFTGIETRDAVYVPLSRGRVENHAYVVSALLGDEHSVLTDKARRPDTVVDILTAMLARDSAQKSATTIDRESADPIRRLAGVVDAYTDAVGTAAEVVAGDEVMATIDAAARRCSDGQDTFDLTEFAAWPVLRKHLATIAVSGIDAVATLDSAARARELATAADAAAVLEWRLDPRGGPHAGTGPLPWMRTIPDALAADRRFGAYLLARQKLVIDLADHVRDLATEWTVADAPRWARPLVTQRAQAFLLADLAVWRAAMGVEDNDRRPTGPNRYAVKESAYQRRLRRRFTRVVGDVDAPSARWAPVVETIDPALTADPFWPILADRLDIAHRAGADIDQLLRNVVDEKNPLPVDAPASALWWRLTRSEGLPAVALDPTRMTSGSLRPYWCADVTSVFGQDIAAVILADPAWPALVAAIESGDPHRWRPGELLDTAAELVFPGQESDDVLRRDQYASALAWRVSAIVHHTPAIDGIPPEPVDPDAEWAAATAAGFTDPYADAPAIDVDANSDVDHAALRPGVGQIPRNSAEPVADPVDADVRYAQLRDAFAAADAEVDRLRAALQTNTGEHSLAAAPVVSALRRRFDAQRPYAIALADARGDFTEADAAARDAESDHRQAIDAVNIARTAVEESGADEIVDASADQLMNLAPEQVASYLDALERVQNLRMAEAAMNTSGHEADHLRAVATEYRLAADAEHAALVDVAGGPDRIVTNDYVLEIAGIATDLDYAALREALARRDALRDEWSRISTEPARSSTRSNTSTIASASTPESKADQRSLKVAVADAALAEVMQSDPIRMLRRAELDERIQHLAAQLQQQDSTMSRWIQHRAAHDATEALARIKAEHATLDRQVPAIFAAQAAASVAADTDRAYSAIASELERLRRQLARIPAVRRATRRRLAAAVTNVERQVTGIAAKRTDAAAQAADTAAAAELLGAPKTHWSRIIRRARDTDSRARELARARAAVDQSHSAEEAARIRLLDRRSELLHQLDAAQAELKRRRSLTRSEREHEIRVQTSEVSGCATGTTNPRRTAQISTKLITSADRTHDRATSIAGVDL